MFKSVVRMETVLKNIFLKSVESVKTKRIFRDQKCLRLCPENGRLFVEVLSQVDRKTPLRVDITDKHCHIVGFGKAVYGMAIEVERILDTHLKSGILSVPCGTLEKFKDTETQPKTNSRIEIFEGAKNNLPDANAHETAVKIKEFAEGLSDRDVLFVLISGGGSALLPLPAATVSLEEKMQVVQLLAKSGASINELNTVRIAISSIKGGKLAISARNASQIVSLIISDIVGDPIDLIASGPTFISGSNYNKAANEIIVKHGLRQRIPNSVRDLLEKSSNSCEGQQLNNNHIVIIANNSFAVNQALEEAEKNGFHAVCLSKNIECDVAQLSEIYVQLIIAIKNYLKSGNEINFLASAKEVLKDLLYEDDFLDELSGVIKSKAKKGICIVAGGETTVQVTGDGLGGRNQELTLRVLKDCLDQDEAYDIGDVGFLSAGTDGIDGPTPAAGAAGTTLFLKNNANPAEVQLYLSANNSHAFWQEIYPAGHIVIGHTGTNVMDLHMLLVPFS
ncbi:glycerate kinase [Phlebotomus argentipes]|uniref:glycerate kinase n=1 Tax=Phlebotomus argentipes TaxID=94469 RepID=UPI0028936E6F|nr:glycerate kinase [Phlebotomus argentipes]